MVVSIALKRDIDVLDKLVDVLAEWSDGGRNEVCVGDRVVFDVDARTLIRLVYKYDEYIVRTLSKKCRDINPDFEFGLVTPRYTRNRYYLAYVPSP